MLWQRVDVAINIPGDLLSRLMMGRTGPLYGSQRDHCGYSMVHRVPSMILPTSPNPKP